jgi:hypothetical protein
MKKLLPVVLAGLLVLTLIPGSATAQKKKGKKQEVEGGVVLPTPFTDDSGCFAGIHRRENAFTMGASNGVTGYHFEVDKKTWKKKFVLEVTGGQGDVDLDIYFYLGPLTTVEDFVNQGGDPTPAATISYNTREPGGEADKVPESAENVIICMYGGGQGAGFGASFTYTAGKGVKLPKS